ncbi:MAG TPA: lysylphosphatidylglycerol synthase transmembrane domain-containing protein [Planctomycetota bacterium]|nr:lysylphosphatidylglycerol synthase transmembrane domain-containing protein [Planctomycetota bacterium]
MSPSARRAAWTAAQIALTAVALVVVFRSVRLRDQVRVDGGPARPARAVETDAGRTTVVWTDGTREAFEAGRAEVEPGLLPLLRGVDRPAAAALTAMLLLPMGLLSARWWLLLRGQGLRLPYARIFGVTWAGIFFNQLLPGGVGGDVTKAVLASAGEDRKAAVVATVLLDRIIGLVVMVFLGAGCLAPFAGRFQDPALPAAVFGLAAALTAGYLAYFNPMLRRVLAGRLPFIRTLRALDEVFRSARLDRRRTLLAAAISMAAQASTILIIYGLARALGIVEIPLWQFFVFEPIIFVVTALPISVGGWGVQEAVYVYLFGTMGGLEPGRAVALSLLFKGATLASALPGGLLFALGVGRPRIPPSAEQGEEPRPGPWAPARIDIIQPCL